MRFAIEPNNANVAVDLEILAADAACATYSMFDCPTDTMPTQYFDIRVSDAQRQLVALALRQFVSIAIADPTIPPNAMHELLDIADMLKTCESLPVLNDFNL